MQPESATPPHNTQIGCAVAASTAPQIDVAIREAAEAAARQLAGAADVAVVFVSARYGAAIRSAMEGLGDVLGTPTMIATTAEAVLAADVEYESEPAVVVWLAHLPGAVVVPFALEYTQTPDGGMFAGWPSALDGGWPDNASIVLLADPFSFPVDALIKRVEEDHPGVPIVGGMASGGYQPGSNTLVVGSKSYDSGAVGFLLGGAARIRPVVSQGCRPIGRPLVITKSERWLRVPDAMSAPPSGSGRDVRSPVGGKFSTCRMRPGARQDAISLPCLEARQSSCPTACHCMAHAADS